MPTQENALPGASYVLASATHSLTLEEPMQTKLQFELQVDSIDLIKVSNCELSLVIQCIHCQNTLDSLCFKEASCPNNVIWTCSVLWKYHVLGTEAEFSGDLLQFTNANCTFAAENGAWPWLFYQFHKNYQLCSSSFCNAMVKLSLFPVT